MIKTEKMTERVTVKMDANLKAKLQREAERCGGDMSAYIRFVSLFSDILITPFLYLVFANSNQFIQVVGWR